ncbi:MAG: hypothetical protein R6X25_01830 [Candidatus Krumholzibacteriia bacterium]
MTSGDAYRKFMRRLPLALLAGLLVWLALRTPLDHAVAWGAETLSRAFEYPRVTRLVVEDHAAQVRRADFRAGSHIPVITLTQIHFNLIVLLALSFALPGLRSRHALERLLMAATVLWASQVLNLLLHVKTMYALGLGEWSRLHYSELAQNVYGFLRHFTDLPGRFSFPFLAWLGFNWKRVRPLLGDSMEPAPAPGRSRLRRAGR